MKSFKNFLSENKQFNMSRGTRPHIIKLANTLSKTIDHLRDETDGKKVKSMLDSAIENIEKVKKKL